MATPNSDHRPKPAPPGCRCSGYGWATPTFHAPDCPYRMHAEIEEIAGLPVRTDPRLPEYEIRVEGRRRAIIPDRRLRTAPHGDALTTRVMPSAIRLMAEMDSLLLERGHEFLGPPRYEVRVIPNTLAGHSESIGRDVEHAMFFGTDPPRRPRFWSAAGNVAGGHLTPGSLKLAGARIMATHKGTDVADEMARQIDFEWEERRWRVPAGDVAAVDNGMGC